MATQRLNLPISNAIPGDGTTNNIPPAIEVYKGTNTGSARFGQRANFSATVLNGLWWSFIVPADYVSGGTIHIVWTANATSGNVVWGASIGCVAVADADTPYEHAQATASTVTTGVNATEARRLVLSSITPALDSMLTGDRAWIFVYRDGANGSDTCSVTSEIVDGIAFDYTS